MGAFVDQTYALVYETVKKIECDKKTNYRVKANPTIFKKAEIGGEKSINSEISD